MSTVVRFPDQPGQSHLYFVHADLLLCGKFHYTDIGGGFVQTASKILAAEEIAQCARLYSPVSPNGCRLRRFERVWGESRTLASDPTAEDPWCSLQRTQTTVDDLERRSDKEPERFLRVL